MTLLITLLIVILIVGGASILAGTISARQKKQDRYLSVITRNAGVATDGDAKAANKARMDISKKLKQAGDIRNEKKKNAAGINMLLQQAGFDVPVSRYWIGAAITAFVTFLLLSALTHWPKAAIVMLAAAAFFGLPKFFLRRKAQKRQKKFLAEFPDALEGSVRLLQAGMPITEAIAMVSREFQGPLREEMMRMYDNQKIGMSIGNAALEMASRVPLTEVHMFATALQIQSETGSSLSEVLTNLSAVIRARFRLKRKVQALSAEAKTSAAIIGCLPLIVTLGLYFGNKKYIMLLFETTKGNVWLGIAIFWMLCGVIIMRQMINFKI